MQVTSDAPSLFATDFDSLASELAGLGGRCVRLFVAGAVTHCGKTTTCLSLLAALRKAGVPSEHLAYIKPATQCEAPDLLQHWCSAEGVEYVGGEQAPLVFYAGFTRSFLAGEQGTSADWVAKIASRVDALARGRRFVIIDGVGFPAVGSIVGVDNAVVARAARAPVLLVGKSGVGGAVDSFNLNRVYFAHYGVPVLGALFNFGARDGSYKWDVCAAEIQKYFVQGELREQCFGVVPLLPALEGLREKIGEVESSGGAEQLAELAALSAEHFARHVDLVGLLAAAAADAWCRGQKRPAGGTSAPAPEASRPAPAPAKRAATKARGEVAKTAPQGGG